MIRKPLFKGNRPHDNSIVTGSLIMKNSGFEIGVQRADGYYKYPIIKESAKQFTGKISTDGEMIFHKDRVSVSKAGIDFDGEITWMDYSWGVTFDIDKKFHRLGCQEMQGIEIRVINVN